MGEVVRNDLSAKITFQQRLEEGGGASCFLEV